MRVTKGREFPLFFRWLFFCTALLCGSASLASAQESTGAGEPPGRMTLVALGNLDGDLGPVDCRASEPSASSWARQVGYFQSLSLVYAAGGISAPIALHVGDSIFPGVLSRYLLSQGEEGAETLATLLAGLPIGAHGLGNREFSVDRQALLRFGEALKNQGIPLQAANLHCEPFQGGEGICHLLGEKPYELISHQNLTIAVTSVLSEDLLLTLAAEQREGLRVLDPKEVLPDVIREMRSEADLVIVQYHLRERRALEQATTLASAVEGIDLLLTSHLESDTAAGRMAVVQAGRTGTPIVSADSGTNSLIAIDLEIRSRGTQQGVAIGTVSPRRVITTGAPLDRETQSLFESAVDRFCSDWGSAIGAQSRLAAPMDLPAMMTFILNVMRFSGRADIAVANRNAFRDEGQFPLAGELTEADIYRALPFENQVVIARVRGALLRSLAPRFDQDLVATGFSRQGTQLLVNGRPIIDNHFYTIATLDFLAAGGDQVFPEGSLQDRSPLIPAFASSSPTLDALVVKYIEAGLHLRPDGPSGIDPVASFPDLHRKFFHTFTGSVNATYNQVMVQSPQIDGAPAYGQSQLTVQSTEQINIDSRLALQSDSRNHRLNNDLTLQYATSRQSEIEDASFEETRDLIRYRTRYRYQRLRAEQAGRWYVPDPLTEGQLETEFTVPEARDYRRLDLRGILGFSFQLVEKLDLRLGANVRRDINQPDGLTTWGVNAGYTLARIDLIRFFGRPLQLESEIEVFYNDITNNNILELRSQNRAFFALFDRFFFTTTFNAFVFRNDAVGIPGRNLELTFGLNYQWENSVQRH